MKQLRFGIQALTLDWSQWPEALAALEALPFSSLLLADHLQPDFADPLVGAAAVAARTSRLRTGTMMLNATSRHPAVVAKAAATLAAFSRQPLELGLGAGWHTAEALAVGMPLGTAAERADRLEESVRIIDGLLSRPSTTVDGRHYQTDEAPPALPLPLSRRPLLMIGAGRPRLLRLAARHADIVSVLAGSGWSVFAVEEWAKAALPASLAEKARTVRAAAESVERDPDSIELSGNPLAIAVGDTFQEAAAQVPEMFRVPDHVMRQSSSYLVGTSDQVREKLEECRDIAGITYFVGTVPCLNLPAVERLRRFGTEIATPLGAGPPRPRRAYPA